MSVEMATVGQNEPTTVELDEAERERRALLAQLAKLERRPAKPLWPWLLVFFGLVLLLAAGYHGYSAYRTMDTINARSNLTTPNPAALFQAVATNGPTLDNRVETSSRATFTSMLQQYAIDGTLVLIGLVLVISGVFVRLNR
jgi:beta-lactamase regulating signal transducer with metallopeptidase domain